MWTVQDAGQPPLPPSQVLERVPGQSQMKATAGSGSDIGTGIARTV
jgi:hypothetical protein